MSGLIGHRGLFLGPTTGRAIRKPFSLLMHMDGAQGETTFTEESGKTVTRGGSVFKDASQKKFGTASATGFNPGDGFLSVPLGAFAGDFSIGLWFFWPGPHLVNEEFVSIGSARSLYIASTYPGGRIAGYGFATVLGNGAQQPPPPAGAWTFLSLDRKSNSLCLAVNGIPIGTITDANTFPAGNFRVGNWADGGEPFKGYIEEVAVLQGESLWNATAFTPPTAPFEYQAP